MKPVRPFHLIFPLLLLAVVAPAQPASAQFTCDVPALNGDDDPDSVDLSTAFGPEVAVNAGGDVLFVGRQAVSGAKDRLYLFATGGDVTVAVANTTAPNGKTYGVSRPFSRPSLNDAGDAAFLARLSTNSDGSGFFVREAGGTYETAVARNVAAPAPLAGTFQKIVAVSGINAATQVAFVATVTDVASPSGVFLYDAPADMRFIVVLQNDAVPDQAGFFFCAFQAVSLEDGSEVAFRASISTDCVNDPLVGGVFRTVAGTPATVALVGDVTPIGGTTVYSRFTGTPQINNTGSVAFPASVGGTANTNGIFLEPAFVALVVRGDGTPPDVGGGSISQIKGFDLDDSDRACFLATFRSSTARSGVLCYDGTIPGRTTVQTRANPPPMPPFAAGAKYSSLLDPAIATDGSVVAMRANVSDKVSPRNKRGVLTCTP